MNNYVTGMTIKALREAGGITQAELARRIGVTSKAVSKWETAKGFPDISLIEPLAMALGVSLTELLSGKQIINRNKSCHMLRTKFYVCPVCGNVIHGTGEAVISCCGIPLPALEAEDVDDHHAVGIEKVEDELFITVHHDMTKEHYISFIAFASCDRMQFIKFYPEGNAETRLKPQGSGCLYIYCNKHGLMKQKL